MTIRFIAKTERGGFFAAAIGYPIITQGDSYDELRNNIEDAISCHFEDDLPDGLPSYSISFVEA